MNNWRDDASCAESSPDVFFPDPIRQPMAFKAVQICKTCTVRLECLDYALRNDERYGIWGGMFPSERAALKKQLRKKDK